MLIGRRVFVTARVSNENALVQVLRSAKSGDNVIASAHGRELIRYGWLGSRKSIPACYLIGLLAGKKAAAAGIKECILYTGNRQFSSRIAACVKGLIDGGVNVPVGEDALPGEERISGKHIADYANALKSDAQAYKSKFSALLKAGFVPENYQEQLNNAKAKILGGTPETVKPKPEAKKVEAKKKEARPKKAEPKPRKAATKEAKEKPKEKKAKPGKKEGKKA